MLPEVIVARMRLHRVSLTKGLEEQGCNRGTNAATTRRIDGAIIALSPPRRKQC